MTLYNQKVEHLVHGVVVGTVKDEYFYKANDTQYFPIGAIYRKGDRAWRYARAVANSAGNLPVTNSMAQNNDMQAINQRVVTDDQAVNTKEVTVTITADDANSGVFYKDQLYGGYITVRVSTTHNQTRMIVGNDAQSGAGDMKIYVDVPWETALTSGWYTSAIFSPYHEIISPTGDDMNTSRSTVGLPVAPATAGQWVWLQTWGPCHVTCELDFHSFHNLQAVVDYSGNILDHDYNQTYQTKAQHIGFIMFQRPGGLQSYEPFLFMQLAP